MLMEDRLLYRLVAPPVVEPHGENLLRLFVRDTNGAPVANAHVRVWAGPPDPDSPTIEDDFPYRTTDPSGMLEYFAFAGPMPEQRDYWLQVISIDSSPQSEPIQFHFPDGSTIWITAMVQAANGNSGKLNLPSTETLSQSNAPVRRDTATQPEDPRDWDPRLTQMHVSKTDADGLAPGQPFWKILSARMDDESECGGKHNLYYNVVDERGMPVPGVPILLDWQGREPQDVPSLRTTDGNGRAQIGLHPGPVSWNPNEGPGPYVAWVGDPDWGGQKGTGIPGERLVGAGLPENHNACFIVTWQKAVAPPPVAVPPSSASSQAGTGLVETQVTPSVSRGNSRISGTVRNAPPNTELTLTAGSQTWTADLDPSGNYSFLHLPAGSFSLSIGGIGTVNPNIALDGSNAIVLNYTLRPTAAQKTVAHYLLFGAPNQSATRTSLILALDYIMRFSPAVGFSVAEAKNAQNVTIVGASAVSPADEQILVSAGCTVRHLAGKDSYAMEQLFAQLIDAGNPFPSA